MTTWEYHGERSAAAPSPTAANTETVGGRQLELLLRARRSAHGTIVLRHGRGKQDNAERMAARRLQERGLLLPGRFVFGGGAGSWRLERGRQIRLYVYGLTERGRTCWLRVQQ